jgi:uncharacterized protein (DUF1330 family)
MKRTPDEDDLRETSEGVFVKRLFANEGKSTVTVLAAFVGEDGQEHHMKYYSVAELDITDRSWVPAYIKNVTKLVEQHGGRYLARTSNIEKIEGERKAPQVFLIIEWPSRDAAVTFYESDEYRPYRQSRREGARNEFTLVAGEDIAKEARIDD